MSGGVDSAVAAARAVEAGHDVTGIHLALSRNPASYRSGARGCCTIEDANDARRAADVIGIPFYVWDLSERFHEDVVEDFMDEYAAGRTPNPCLRCNEKIKFAAVLDRALGLGFDAVATGHYAQLRTGADGLVEMHRAVDHGKDQSYVLGVLDQEQLRHSLFPLGGSTKADVRREAAERGLLVADKPDSHDICFVADGDNAGWLREKLGDRAPNHGGDVVDESGEVVGTHDGTYAFTIGQRRGCGSAARRGRQAALRARHRAGLRHRHRRPARAAGRAPADAASGRAGAAASPGRSTAPCSCARTATSSRPGSRVGESRRHRAARAGVRHRARPGRRRLRRHPRGRLRDDRGDRMRRDRRRVDARRRPSTRRCASCSASCPGLPHLPEVPGRGATATMTGRGLAVMAELGADLQPAGWRLTDGGAGSTTAGRAACSRRTSTRSRSRRRAPCRPGWPFKVQVAGPWTLAATVEKPRGDKVLADRGARRELAQALAEGLRDHVADVRRRLPGVDRLVVQVDEPALAAVLAGQVPTASGFDRHRSVDLPEASQALEWVLGAVADAGAEPWVHSCAAGTPLGLLRGAGARGLSVDLAMLSAADHDALAEALEAGETVALGVRPRHRAGARADRRPGHRVGAALAGHARPRPGRGG